MLAFGIIALVVLALCGLWMADTYRWRYGDTAPAIVAFDVGTAIELGSLCYIDASDSNTAKAAGSFTWDTDLATTQAAFHLVFMGVAMQSYDGDAAPHDIGLKDGKIRIATEGVFEFDCASATFAAGALVGPAKQTGDLLEPQKVVAVATESLAIGRVQEAVASATKVKVRIRSPKMNLSA
jgi:hypothetical protein